MQVTMVPPHSAVRLARIFERTEFLATAKGGILEAGQQPLPGVDLEVTVSIFARNGSNTDITAAHLARQATASLAGLLSGLGMSRSDLAKAMGVSPGRVSQIMSGDANLTVRTLAAAADALGAGVKITFYAHPETADGHDGGSGSASPTQDSSLPSGSLR